MLHVWEYVFVKIIHCLWVISMQVAWTKWYLGVQTLDFINLYNVEIINGVYCCCDDSEICASDFDNLLGKCEDASTTQVCKQAFLYTWDTVHPSIHVPLEKLISWIINPVLPCSIMVYSPYLS